MSEANLFRKDELKQSLLGSVLLRLPVLLLKCNGKLLRMVVERESNVFYSYSLRLFLRSRYKIILGSYSYGNISDLLNFPVNTIIGRYTSIGPGVRAFAANHPINFLSTHPFFFRSDIGFVKKEKIERGVLTIGHDVWIGCNAIICPGCSRIGNGAVIGAGAVVTKDVPDFSVVVGNPAKEIKRRFNENIIRVINETKWWNQRSGHLKEHIDVFSKAFESDDCSRLRDFGAHD